MARLLSATHKEFPRVTLPLERTRHYAKCLNNTKTDNHSKDAPEHTENYSKVQLISENENCKLNAIQNGM